MPPPSEKNKTIRSLEDAYLEMIVGVSPEKETKKEPSSAPSTSTSKFAPASPEQGFGIMISNDRMTAFLRASGSQPKQISTEDIYKALDRQGVTFGIDRNAVMHAVQLLQTTGGWQGELPVAQGQPASHGPEPHFAFLERRINPSDGTLDWVANNEILDFPLVKKVLSRTSLDEIKKIACRVRVVTPGEVIATFDRPLTSSPGCDVCGQPLLSEPMILAGEHVHCLPQDKSLRSMIFGFLHVEANTISVLSPIWMTPDKLTAVFVNLPQVGEWRSPSSSQLETLLRMQGVASAFIRPEILAQASERLKRRDTTTHLVKVATSLPVRPGANASFTYFFETEAKAGTLKEGDVFDLRERGLITSVTKDTVLAEKVLATKGMDGITLSGEAIKAVDGTDVVISTNEGVYEEKHNNSILYRAKQDGVVSYHDKRLTVIDLFEVRGDVDYNTGNIEVTTPVLVLGSVSPGFTLKSGGNVHIRGTVELGCTVLAHGDLAIDGGIFGSTTRIIAFGTLRCAFIQDAEVIVKGDIVVQSYIHGASIRCGGTVTVLRGLDRRGGKIVGGVVCATKGIEAAVIGSEACQSTLLIIQNRPEDTLAMEKLQNEGKLCAESILKMTRTLHLDSIAPQRLKALLAATAPEKRGVMLKVLQMLNSYVKKRETLAGQEKELFEKMTRELGEGVIRATDTFFQGNTVQFGDRKIVAPSDLSPASFKIKEGIISF